jgi:hypothetical protein
VREIKFRGWNAITKSMIDLKKITPLAMDSKLKCDGLFIPFMESMEIMQFTGLKDRKGEDIYEGDIVKEFIMEDLFEVIFTDYGNFGLKPISAKAIKHLPGHEYETIDPSYAKTSLTVVGNVHDNPELIK